MQAPTGAAAAAHGKSSTAIIAASASRAKTDTTVTTTVTTTSRSIQRRTPAPGSGAPLAPRALPGCPPPRPVGRGAALAPGAGGAEAEHPVPGRTGGAVSVVAQYAREDD